MICVNDYLLLDLLVLFKVLSIIYQVISLSYILSVHMILILFIRLACILSMSWCKLLLFVLFFHKFGQTLSHEVQAFQRVMIWCICFFILSAARPRYFVGLRVFLEMKLHSLFEFIYLILWSLVLLFCELEFLFLFLTIKVARGTYFIISLTKLVYLLIRIQQIPINFTFLLLFLECCTVIIKDNLFLSIALVWEIFAGITSWLILFAMRFAMLSPVIKL